MMPPYGVRHVPEARIKRLSVLIDYPSKLGPGGAIVDRYNDERLCQMVGEELARKLFEHRKVYLGKNSCYTFVEIIVQEGTFEDERR
jgi:hypothetical protein